MSEFEADVAAFRAWWPTGAKKKRAQSTCVEYVRQIRRWRKWQLERDPAAGSTPTLREVRAYVAEERDRSEWSAHGAVRALKAWSRWLVEDGVVETDPLATMEYLDEPEPTNTPYAELNDIELLLQTCNGESLEDYRDRAIICLLRATGMRRGELVQIHWNDIDWGANTIALRNETVKGGRGHVVGFDAETRTALRRYRRRIDKYELDNRKDFSSFPEVWLSRSGGALTNNGLTQAMQKRYECAGVHTPVHSFRRGLTGRWLKERRSDVLLTELMGWSTPRMIARYARKVTAELALEQQMEMLEDERRRRMEDERRRKAGDRRRRKSEDG